MDNQYLERFDEALEAWTDERFVTRQQIRDLATFHMYLVNLAEADGWFYNGHSVKVGYSMTRLTVKATRANVPLVVFVSGTDTTDCIHIFLRHLSEKRLDWTVDKYR
jgi:hypothetical protein